MDAIEKGFMYQEVVKRVELLLDDCCDRIADMATIVCELHHTFDYFHWTGFYRTVATDRLQIGPYQGGHGCLHIPFGRGVCGIAAKTGKIQIVPDVSLFPGHISCSASTSSEIVIPVIPGNSRVVAVLDIDSNDPDAFDPVDRDGLDAVCRLLAARYI